jgi:hypothetical protein
MKKILSIFIAVMYLATSSGLALQVHYCMDKVTGTSLAGNDEQACNKCGMKKASNPCCKDEFKFVKLQDAHKLLMADYEVNAPVAEIHTGYLSFHTPLKDVDALKGSVAHSPPGLTGYSLNILHCVFRI